MNGGTTDRKLKLLDQIAGTTGSGLGTLRSRPIGGGENGGLLRDRRGGGQRIDGFRLDNGVSGGIVILLSDRLSRAIERSERTRRIVTLELAEKLVLEIERRLLPGRLRNRICGYTRLEADDSGKFGERIIIRKEIRLFRASYANCLSAIPIPLANLTQSNASALWGNGDVIAFHPARQCL